ncbi:MAG: hypothetical protein EXX96DRAFT_183568 [Benjaminiella poitrasii]|nr:MAG: hypothetical protein EXX96DRAFT_183568 [Benjaminiella poitrasii]
MLIKQNHIYTTDYINISTSTALFSFSLLFFSLSLIVIIMKFCSYTILFIALVSLYFTTVNAFSHPLDLILSDAERHQSNIANFLVKRRANDHKKKKSNTKKVSKKRKSGNCSNARCPLKLQACPKACPQTCGYLNSPDPCCPLLGKPTCPDL